MIDLSALDLDVEAEARVRQLLAEEVERNRFAHELRTVLDYGSDHEISRFGAALCTARGSAAIVPADTYGDEWFEPTALVLVRGACALAHPRRPVLMRGSRPHLVWAYGRSSTLSANGFCEAIISRYLRRNKVTCFDFLEVSEIVSRLRSALAKKYPGVSYHFCRDGGLSFVDTRDHQRKLCLVNGRSVWLTVNQFNYIKALFAIARRSDKLEERVELLRQYRRGLDPADVRMAA